MNTPPLSLSSAHSPPPRGQTPGTTRANRKKRRHPSAQISTLASSRPDLDLVGPPTPSSGTSSLASMTAVGPSDQEELYAAAAVPPYGDPGIPGRPGDFEGVSGSESLEGYETTGVEMGGYTESICSALRNHVYEGGLRYHAYRDGKYPFPNDEIEQNCDDMKHTMTLWLMNQRYFFAPVERVLDRGANVVDLGTGTGIWCVELADMCPNTTFHGVDLSPIQPTMVSPNIYWELDDIEDEWVFPQNHFDYVHIRHTLHSIKDKHTLLRRIYQHLKPGGYVEIQELHYFPHCDDDSCRPDTPYAFRDFLRYLRQGLRALGSELDAILTLPRDLQYAGFAEIKHASRKCPIGVWSRDRDLRYAGLFLQTAIMDGLRGLAKRPLGTGLLWTPLQIEIFLVDVRKAVMNGNFHTYLPFHVVHARKPIV